MRPQFSGKNVLIFGLGINRGGLGSARFFAASGANVRVTDLKTAEQLKPSLDELCKFPNIEYALGRHSKEDIDWADLIIKNPGVRPGNSYIEYARAKGKEVEMDMGIFLQFVSPARIVGITGTKGKSTTSSLIYEVLKNEYKDVIFAGNIGKSVLDAVKFVNPQTIVVLEISSFQLEAFASHKVSPHWSVITNITPDHLNYYSSMEEYIEAKRPIAMYQKSGDYLFLRKGDEITTTQSFIKGFQDGVVYFSPDDLPDGFKPLLPGEHNLNNYAAALAVAKIFGIDQVKTLSALASFGGVEFRLQLVKEWQGVKIYNDTASTGPDAGIKALQTFPGCILIAGGVNKNLPYEEYAHNVDNLAKSVFFLEGDATEEIKKYLKHREKIVGTYNNLEQLLVDVKNKTASGDVVLFSPAAASFNLFQNEFDRGRKFNATVEKVFV